MTTVYRLSRLHRRTLWLCLCLLTLWGCEKEPAPKPEPPSAPKPLSAPTLRYPQNGAADVPANPVTLQWDAVTDPQGGTVTYELQLEVPDRLIGVPITEPGEQRMWLTISAETVGAATTFAVTPYIVHFWPDLSYRWKVTVISSSGEKATSDIFTFTTEEKRVDGWKDGEVRVYQENTVGGDDAWTLILTGDGFTTTDLEDGGHWETVSARAVEAIFSVEPFRTYRSHIRVLRIGAVSQERGVSAKPNQTNGICTVIKNTRFGTMYDQVRSAWCGLYAEAEYKEIDFWPPTGHPGKTADDADALIRSWVIPEHVANDAKMNNVAIVILMNVEEDNGTEMYYEDANTTMGFITLSAPYFGPTRQLENIMVHEVGGHGIGHLADEYVSTPNVFPEDRKQQTLEFQARGYYENVDVSGSQTTCPWKHFFSAPEYATYYGMVGYIEGARSFGRGIWRAEENSCMRYNELYFNPVQRESIVKKLKTAAGETHTWAGFVEKDYERLHPRGANRSGPSADPDIVRLPEPRIVRVGQ